mmetsp:Transcript_856/g.935  ORF Transcript_856/g.935 Transcript_856/m.935 type:complete len:435 (+) Transcript_856:80-1384(+)
MTKKFLVVAPASRLKRLNLDGQDLLTRAYAVSQELEDKGCSASRINNQTSAGFKPTVRLLSREEISCSPFLCDHVECLEFVESATRERFVTGFAQELKCFAIGKGEETVAKQYETTNLIIDHIDEGCSEVNLGHALRATGVVTKVEIDREEKVGYVEITHFYSQERRKTRLELEKIRKRMKEEAIRKLQADISRTHGTRSGWKSGTKRKQGGTATVFREWLQDQYGIELLNSGSGILDVAGGKGELAFKLLNYAGIKTTIVDPRPYNTLRMLKYLSKDHVLRLRQKALSELKQGKNNEVKSVSVRVPLPGHIRCWFSFNTNSETVNFEKSTDYAAESLSSTTQELDRLTEHIKSCSMICGFHPDQATEPIVDCALALKKPFAIVPCCVFPKLFKHRSHIVSHDAFCKFLLAKDSAKVKMSTLSFFGRNKVLYSL